MQRFTRLALVGTLSIGSALTPLAAFAAAETLELAEGAAVGEITGTVTVVNTEKRMLTIQKPDGQFQVIHVPEEVKRLDEVKINDKLTVSYLEAVAVDLKKGAAAGAPGAVVTKEVDREPGKKPAGSIVEQLTVSGTVEAVNKAKSTVTIRGPVETVTLTVQDPTLLKDVAVGDTVEATFIKAVAAKIQ